MISWSASLLPFCLLPWKDHALFSDWETDWGEPKPPCSLKQKYSTNPRFLREGEKLHFLTSLRLFFLWFLSIVIVTTKSMMPFKISTNPLWSQQKIASSTTLKLMSQIISFILINPRLESFFWPRPGFVGESALDHSSGVPSLIGEGSTATYMFILWLLLMGKHLPRGWM